LAYRSQDEVQRNQEQTTWKKVLKTVVHLS
jgi:hypothetical protein